MKKGGKCHPFFVLSRHSMTALHKKMRPYSYFVYLCTPKKTAEKDGFNTINGGDWRETLQVQRTDSRAHFRAFSAYPVLHQPKSLR